LDAIVDSQRDQVAASLRESGHEILPISIAQMTDFAGNLLELASQDGASLWVMSSRAHAALSPAQRMILSRRATLLHSPLATIESVGGGGARCMLAELFLPRQR
jgi:hypothetical protein